MPSPFPGMDPFLEHPTFFPDLHDRLITHLSEALQGQLPNAYNAVIGSRVWVETSRRSIEPDIHVVKNNGASPAEANGGGTTLATTTRTKPVVITVPHDQFRETRVEVFYGAFDNERLVTVIELLSLTNKTPGEQGRELYLRKQCEILESKVHLVEIDLLRGGWATTAVPHDLAIAQAGPFDYHVCIHRFDQLENYFVYPILLTEPLPEIAIPLLPGEKEIPLDLQALFQRCYHSGPYRRRLRYQEELLMPPVRPELAEWLQQLVTQKHP